MGPVRSIAARLRRFHKWNCPFLNRKERDTAWLGMYGELAAASFLRAEGCVILRRNWRPVRGGELDIVCREGECLVFVEVKARSAGSYAEACEVISYSQQRKIIKTAQFFLQRYPNYYNFDCRFDVICFDFPQKLAKTVQPDFSKLQYDQQWIKHAFTLD